MNVLITGCSTGIGRYCALSLDRAGHKVFAGVRKKKDADTLKSESSDRLCPVILDVTDNKNIKSALEEVKHHLAGAGLDGLVNNAGIAVSGPMECIPLEDFEWVLKVNVTGQVAVTQAFLPLVRKARGRIVFMGSESGRFTLPMVGAYSASKHALEAVANALRAELAGSRIRVSTIEPASIKTEIWEKVAHQGECLARGLAPELFKTYERELTASAKMTRALNKLGIPASRVEKAVTHALLSRRPKARYVVGLEAWAFIAWHSLAPLSVSARVNSRVLRFLGRHS